MKGEKKFASAEAVAANRDRDPLAGKPSAPPRRPFSVRLAHPLGRAKTKIYDFFNRNSRN